MSRQRMSPAVAAWPKTAATVRMGRDMSLAMTNLKDCAIWRRRLQWAAEVRAEWAQGTSKLLQKSFSQATVMRAEPPLMDWELTWERAERSESMRYGPRRCS
nr:hypothetical protein CFP56_14368 [Quercus suber]